MMFMLSGRLLSTELKGFGIITAQGYPSSWWCWWSSMYFTDWLVRRNRLRNPHLFPTFLLLISPEHSASFLNWLSTFDVKALVLQAMVSSAVPCEIKVTGILRGAAWHLQPRNCERKETNRILLCIATTRYMSPDFRKWIRSLSVDDNFTFCNHRIWSDMYCIANVTRSEPWAIQACCDRLVCLCAVVAVWRMHLRRR